MLYESPILARLLLPQAEEGSGYKDLLRDCLPNLKVRYCTREANCESGRGVLRGHNQRPSLEREPKWRGGQTNAIPIERRDLWEFSRKPRRISARWRGFFAPSEGDFKDRRVGIQDLFAGYVRRRRRRTEEISIGESMRGPGVYLWCKQLYPDWWYEELHTWGGGRDQSARWSLSALPWPDEGSRPESQPWCNVLPQSCAKGWWERLNTSSYPRGCGYEWSDRRRATPQVYRASPVDGPPGRSEFLGFSSDMKARRRCVNETFRWNELDGRDPDYVLSEWSNDPCTAAAGITYKTSEGVWRPSRMGYWEDGVDQRVTVRWSDPSRGPMDGAWQDREGLYRSVYQEADPKRWADRWCAERFCGARVAERRGICNR
jgi:hypothetical protein